MKDAYYYPWLGIWFEPSDTIAYLRDKRHAWFVLLFLLLFNGLTLTFDTVDMAAIQPLYYTLMTGIAGAVLVVYGFLVYLAGKLLKGKARLFEVIVASFLSTFPSIAAYFIGVASLSISSALEHIFKIWSLVIFVAMVAHIEQFSKIKSLIVNLIAVIPIVLIAGYLGAFEDDTKNQAQALLSQHTSHPSEAEDALKPPSTTPSGIGFKNDPEFIEYSKKIFERHEPNNWKRASMNTQTQSWISTLSESNITQEDLDLFFEQIETIQKASQQMSGTSKKIFESLPYTYTRYLDQKLQKMLDSSIQVPLTTLYTETGETIRDMNRSRHFFVSQVYNRIGDFYDDELDDKSTALSYVKKGVQACPLNPNTLHMASYYDDNATANVARYDRVLKLIQKSDTLFDYALSAVKNNLGFQIYRADMTERYDEAIGYLHEAYDHDNDMAYSLATIASIYNERNQTQKAYKSLEVEALRFLGYDDDTIKDLDNRYWTFGRQLIDTSFAAKDYRVTRYVCNKYLKHHDKDYETCLDDLKKIRHLPKDKKITPVYSVWDQYLRNLDAVFGEAPQ